MLFWLNHILEWYKTKRRSKPFHFTLWTNPILCLSFTATYDSCCNRYLALASQKSVLLHCPKHLSLPWKYTFHAQTPRDQPSCKTEQYHKHGKKTPTKQHPHQTCFGRKLRASEKTSNSTTTLEPLGFHSLQTEQAEKKWKFKEPPPVLPRKNRWWILFCPQRLCE